MKLWHIDSSAMSEFSSSRTLSAGIVARLVALHPGVEVEYLDLGVNPVQHLLAAHIGAMGVDPAENTQAEEIDAKFGDLPKNDALEKDIARGNGFISTLFAADIIVIGMPMYNYGIPSTLKAWADRILVAGKTFKYGPTGPTPLLPAGKKVYFASTTGGLYSEGHPGALKQHQESHLRAILNLIGLTDITVIGAEGLAIPGLKEPALAQAQAAIAALT